MYSTSCLVKSPIVPNPDQGKKSHKLGQSLLRRTPQKCVFFAPNLTKMLTICQLNDRFQLLSSNVVCGNTRKTEYMFYI